MRVSTAQRQHIILADVLADVLIQQRVITMVVQPLIMTMVHVTCQLRVTIARATLSAMKSSMSSTLMILMVTVFYVKKEEDPAPEVPIGKG